METITILLQFLKMGNESCIQGLNCNKLEQACTFQTQYRVQLPPTEPQKPVRLPKVTREIDGVLKLKEKLLMEFVQRQSEMKILKLGEDVYEGQFNALKIPHGLGKMYKADGALFVGRFSHGKAEGEGLYILKDGSYYEGLFKDNVAQCPKGTFCCKDYTYTGAFKSNKFHGQGQQNSNRYSFNGTYLNGVRECGELKWWAQPGEENEYSYYGKFDANGLFTDDGILKQPTGKYTGPFFMGKKHGEGVYRFNNNIKYEGHYSNGIKEGYGKVSFISNGELIYQGNWKENMPSGEGFRFDEKGIKEKTYYVDGINVLALKDPQSLYRG